MKDPLQTEATPYDILGVPNSATAADIDKAFKVGLVKKANVQKLNGARAALQRPVDRTLVDILQYRDDHFEGLIPDPRQDATALNQSRVNTAASWEQMLVRGYPNWPLTHCLAVSYFWWTNWAAEMTASGTSNIDPTKAIASLEPLWQVTLGYWAMLLASDNFWSECWKVPPDVSTPVRAAVEEKLRRQLDAYSQKHRQAGAMGLVDMYARMLLSLDTELQTAREVGALNLRVRFQSGAVGTINGGLLMLRRLKLVDLVTAQLGDKHRALAEALSPLSDIFGLLDRNKPAEALARLDALPEGEKRKPEVGSLRVRTLRELARQQASVDQTDAALQTLKRALEDGAVGDQAQDVVNAIVETAEARALALQDSSMDDAIALLDRAIALVPDGKLEIMLADFLTRRAIQITNQYMEENPDDPAIAKVLEEAEAMLVRAARLGSDRAAEQIKALRGLQKEVKLDWRFDTSLPEEIKAILTQAQNAANNGQGDAALKILRRGLRLPAARASESVKHSMAGYLVEIAVDQANAAVAKVRDEMDARNNTLEVWLERLSVSTPGFYCGGCMNSLEGRPFYHFTLDRFNIQTRLCETCTAKMKELMGPITPPPEARSMMRYGLELLREATRLDPDNERVQRNREGIGEVMQKLNIRPARINWPVIGDELRYPTRVLHKTAVVLSVTLLTSMGFLIIGSWFANVEGAWQASRILINAGGAGAMVGWGVFLLFTWAILALFTGGLEPTVNRIVRVADTDWLSKGLTDKVLTAYFYIFPFLLVACAIHMKVHLAKVVNPGGVFKDIGFLIVTGLTLLYGLQFWLSSLSADSPPTEGRY